MSKISENQLNNLLGNNLNKLKSKYDENVFKQEIQKYTCYNCPNVKTCHYAYDDYNINNDCLAEK